MASQTTVEERIAEQIKSKLVNDCSFKQFSEINIKPEIKRMEVGVEIQDDEILVVMIYPIVIRKGKFQTTITEFATDYESDFGDLYGVARTIVDDDANGGFVKDDFLLSHLDIKITKDALSKDNRVYVVSKDGGEEHLIFATLQQWIK